MKESKNPSDESIIKVMEFAWKDHHHARNQTWKTVQIVAVLGAGLLSVDFKYNNFWATLSAAIIIINAAIFGILITWHHRKLEIRKFIHIMNCEEYLGLHRYNLIPLDPGEINKFVEVDEVDKYQFIRLQTGEGKDTEMIEKVKASKVAVPKMFQIHDILTFWRKGNSNTALFIMRIHFIILIFALIILIVRFMLFYKFMQ